MKATEADDPLELVAVSYPVTSRAEADAEMARVLVEEFALAGFTAREVASLFESPAYAAPHGILARQGPDFVRSVILSVYGGTG